jgi:hypothetical protein
MHCRTKALRPARSSNLKRLTLGRDIRSGTTRVQQKFHPSELIMSNATAASIYKWMKKKNGKTKARITIGKGGYRR